MESIRRKGSSLGSLPQTLGQEARYQHKAGSAPIPHSFMIELRNGASCAPIAPSRSEAAVTVPRDCDVRT